MKKFLSRLVCTSVLAIAIPTMSAAQLANAYPSLEELIDAFGIDGALRFIELNYVNTLGNEAKNLHWQVLRLQAVPLLDARRAEAEAAERRQRILDRQPNQAARDRVARELANDEYRPEYDPTSPEWVRRKHREFYLGPIYSRIELGSGLSIGTYATTSGDEFGSANSESHLDRYGVRGGYEHRFDCASIKGLGLGCDLVWGTDFEWATGETSYSGMQTVGQGGVTFVGLTYNENIGNSTGIGSGFAGDGIESSGTFTGTWGKFGSGFQIEFDLGRDADSPADATLIGVPWYPGAGGFSDLPGAGNWTISLAPTFEFLSTDASGLATLTRGGAPLAFSQTHSLSTRDNWYGGAFGLGYSVQVSPKLELGITGRADVAYHVGQGDFRQDTITPGGTTTQTISYRDEGMTLGGGLEVSATYSFDKNTSIRFHGEVAVLPGATGFDARTSPNDMQGAFQKSDLTRTTVGFEFLRSF